MKLKLNRDFFSNGLGLVSSLAGSKVTLPILGNVLIEATEGRVSLTTTNLDVGMRCAIKADVSVSGSVTLPAKRLAGIVRELPNMDVELSVKKNHEVTITSGGSVFRIMGIGKDDFPPLPEFGEEKAHVLAQDELEGMLRSIDHAQSSDENRYVLRGVYFQFQDDHLRLVATDGRRLAVVSKEMKIPAGAAGSIILPTPAVGEVSRLLGKGTSVKINFTDRCATFTFGTDKDSSGLIGDIYLYSKVVEGKYPNFQQVIPKDKFQRVTLERETLLSCIRRAALVCSDKGNSVKLKLTSNLLEVRAQSADFGEAHEEMPVAYDGPDLQVAFNPDFLIDPLRSLTKDEVYFEFKDEASPGVLKTSESFVSVIMPVRIT